MVIERVEHLKQPEVFPDNIKRSIKFIGSKLRKWVELNCEMSLLQPSNIDLSVKFCFTPHGTMDRKKTAEVVVKDENLDIWKRYKWASVYCLRDDIWELWNVMSTDCQETILNVYSPSGEVEHMEEQLLRECYDESKYFRNMICLWTLAVKKEQPDYALSFPHLIRIFHISVKFKNKAATEYFLQGLKQHSSLERVWVNAAKYFCQIDPDPDFLCFLLSKMSEETQLKVFKDIPCEIMGCFLCWPFYIFFLETSACIWESFSPEDYKRMLHIIIFNSVELFEEFWQKSPTELKQHITSDNYTLVLLIEQKDKKNSVLMLREMAAIGKTELTNCVRNVCKLFLSINKWSSLKFFIRKCLLEDPPQDEMIQFKEELEKYLLSTDLREKVLTCKQEWDDIFKGNNCQEGSSSK